MNLPWLWWRLVVARTTGPVAPGELGRVVKLIAPRYVRPFVKRQKNGAADAEAILVAAQRPEMRFVHRRVGR